MRFVRGDWKPGALAAFEKFKDYAPRNEPGEWWAGGKVMYVDRVEWVIMPDPATASAALQSGEIDWWETPVPDLVPVLKRNRNIRVDIADPLGNIGAFRLNHMHPPFNDVKARRAVQMALSQEDYMRAVVGSDTNLWKPIPSSRPLALPSTARTVARRSRVSATTTPPRSFSPKRATAACPSPASSRRTRRRSRRWVRSPRIS